MALNPIVFTENVVRSFLRYQLTAYPFADERLHRQMRELLSLDRTRESPLLKGPYISLSRPFRQGAAVEDLVAEGVFHPLMRQRIPEAITHLYGHQEEAVRAVHAGRTTLVSTGTGSGKTECFLYPIVSRCLELRDAGAPAGICAVIVYPMNALAEDQLVRLRSLLAGTGISFGMYVGKTPEFEKDVAGIRLPVGASRSDYEAELERTRRERRADTVYPPEEVCSREVMRRPGCAPRILLTNVKQLELLLTRGRDVELFSDARLDYLVFDEAHTFTGAQGAETACLVRRLRAFCGREAADTVCIATSATIADARRPDAARAFAARFFGVEPDDVTTITEAYERDTWAEGRGLPPAPTADPAALLAECVQAVEAPEEDGTAVRALYRRLCGAELPPGAWPEALHAALAGNELAYQISETLGAPQALSLLPGLLRERVGREPAEAEILCWLTLGAASRNEGRPLLRPVVHAFVRGISGAVVTFPAAEPGPKLWLAAEDEIERAQEIGAERSAHFPATTCTTCGQHYLITFLSDFIFTAQHPEGGQADDGARYWEPLEENRGGSRVVLTDRLLGSDDEDDLDGHARTVQLYFCRACGTAHAAAGERCLGCGVAGTMVSLYAIRQKNENPGRLTSCLSCGANGQSMGGGYREPARPVRATNVADVHVLAQDMVQHSERPRLLVFCDNRQDAAFQAGWMKDHARRFRLRALMYEELTAGRELSVGDLAAAIDARLEADEALSRALVPEVWEVVRREGEGGRHERERRKFLRIQVLREVTMSARQPIGLEPWGRMKVEYRGLDQALPWIQTQARAFGMAPEVLRDGIATVLDYLRRRRALRDPEHHIFEHFWQDGDTEILQGYLPQFGGPVGTKLRRNADDKYTLQWMSARGDTTIRQMVRSWHMPQERQEEFLEGLFGFLTSTDLLVPAALTGSRGRALPHATNLYQVDADRLRLTPHTGVYRCRDCRRRTPRRTPFDACPAWRCKGSLEYVREEHDDYNLQLLDQGYTMLRPEEHTAMVPHAERERLENLFKGTSEAINAFVCTPTLELGVDIGQLDAVLMRNVPPLPANYWQRAGRAGRRHRMAVDITYCRPVSHDRAYFAEPPKLLAGRVEPPAFNLRNELMVAKHVHATAITRLHQYTRDMARPEAERNAAADVLATCLPARVGDYLFAEGNVRTAPFDLAPLRLLIDAHLDDLVGYVERAFRQGWPTADADVTRPEALRAHVGGMAERLAAVIDRLRRRLDWAMGTIRRLNAVRERAGSLEPEDDALFRRCDQLVKRLKGTARRSRREAEGYDEANTFGVLAAEGFLPGYGLETGSVLATAEIPFWRTGAMTFTLPRPSGVALREYVPGNLIYANGNRFVARHFHRDADEDRNDLPTFEISAARQAVKQVRGHGAIAALDGAVLEAMAVCDVDLAHSSHISDEEDVRFQLGVAVYGMERGEHAGGMAYLWGGRALQHRRGVRMRLVNVGAASAIKRFGRFGYPVCSVCGHSTSPLSSDRERERFEATHRERCGRAVAGLGFYSDVVADALSLPACPDQKTAYSVLEALRFAAARALDMHMEDLQILVIGHVDRDEVDAVLWDPMPGGSGLLDQFCDRFGEIVETAIRVVEDCPAACTSSCIDCLQTFRNGYYHAHLDRTAARDCLLAWGTALERSHAIPPQQPAQQQPDAYPANEAERRLRHLLLAAGFGEGIRGEQIVLDRALGSTTPDVIYRAPHHDQDEGACVYLDGLSAALHGNPATAEHDRAIRDWLRNNGYDVLEIAASDLHDQTAMTNHFRRLAGYLRQDDLRSRLRADSAWYTDAEAGDTERPATTVPGPTGEQPTGHGALRIVHPKPDERYRGCVPLVPLKAAAGAFSGSQEIDEDAVQWVAVDTPRKLRRGMFVAQAVGRSMEPRIADGAWCLFSAPVEGTRQGKIVLVQLRDATDPETGGRYTVKRYRSEKTSDGEMWRHIRITLEPLNREFMPIELTADDEESVMVVAELLDVVG